VDINDKTAYWLVAGRVEAGNVLDRSGAPAKSLAPPFVTEEAISPRDRQIQVRGERFQHFEDDGVLSRAEMERQIASEPNLIAEAHALEKKVIAEGGTVDDVLKRLRGQLGVETEPELVAAKMVYASIDNILDNPPRDPSLPVPELPELKRRR
jgi:hypothetical protein